jgi:putative hydrolase of the HAD superfamily
MPFPHPETPSPAAPDSIVTVLFDYGMVLSGPPDPAAWAEIRSITGLNEEPLHEAYWAFRHDYDRGALTGRAYWHAIADRTGISLSDIQITRLFAADVDLWTQPNQPMIDWAGRLQSASIRTGILSNIGDAIAEGIVAKLPWISRFNHCTWSHALFLAKPDPEIYIRTAEALNADPAKILFIDDRIENIQAASAVGMQTFHYLGHAAFDNEMRNRGFSFLLDLAGTEPAHATELTRS